MLSSVEHGSAPAERTTALVVTGWILVALTVIFPPLAIAAIGVGVVTAKRGRFGTGVALVVGALLAAFAFFYLASQTLIPRN
jgi:hypothetical protein